MKLIKVISVVKSHSCNKLVLENWMQVLKEKHLCPLVHHTCLLQIHFWYSKCDNLQFLMPHMERVTSTRTNLVIMQFGESPTYVTMQIDAAQFTRLYEYTRKHDAAQI